MHTGSVTEVVALFWIKCKFLPQYILPWRNHSMIISPSKLAYHQHICPCEGFKHNLLSKHGWLLTWTSGVVLRLNPVDANLFAKVTTIGTN